MSIFLKTKKIYPYSKREPYGNSKRMLAACKVIFNPKSVMGMSDTTINLTGQQSLAVYLKKRKNDGDIIRLDKRSCFGGGRGRHGSFGISWVLI